MTIAMTGRGELPSDASSLILSLVITGKKSLPA